jgi:hypothetical protein
VAVEVPEESVNTEGLLLVTQLLLGEEVLLTPEILQFTDQEIPLRTMPLLEQLILSLEEPVELKPRQ